MNQISIYANHETTADVPKCQYYSLWFDPTGDRTQYLSTLIITPQRMYLYNLSQLYALLGTFGRLNDTVYISLHDNNRKFLHIPFANKGIDAINISNILNRKVVVKEIPPYLKNQSVPIVSYSYTNSIGRKMFNYKEALQDIKIEEYIKNPLTCDCSHSPFQYNPSGHVITGDLNIIQHESPKGDFSWS